MFLEFREYNHRIMPFFEPENPNDHDLNHDIRRYFGLEGTTTVPPTAALTSSPNIVTANTPTLAIINSPAAVIENSPSTAMDCTLSTLPFLPFFYTSLSSVSDISFSSAMDTSIDTPAIYSSPSPSYSPIDTAINSDASSSKVIEVIDAGLVFDTSECEGLVIDTSESEGLVIDTSESGQDQPDPLDQLDQPDEPGTLAEINFIYANRPSDPHFVIYQREMNLECTDYFAARADAASSRSGYPLPPNNTEHLYDASDDNSGDEEDEDHRPANPPSSSTATQYPLSTSTCK